MAAMEGGATSHEWTARSGTSQRSASRNAELGRRGGRVETTAAYPGDWGVTETVEPISKYRERVGAGGEERTRTECTARIATDKSGRAAILR